MPQCQKCGAFTGPMEKNCPSCGAPSTDAAMPITSFGYRIGQPEKARAIDVIMFEVQELGNDHMVPDVAAALGASPPWAYVELALKRRFGEDATGMWLCRDPEWAKKRYGPGDLYKVRIPSDAIVGSDLGDDGQFWIWRKQPVHEELVEEASLPSETCDVLKEAADALFFAFENPSPAMSPGSYESLALRVQDLAKKLGCKVE